MKTTSNLHLLYHQFSSIFSSNRE